MHFNKKSTTCATYNIDNKHNQESNHGYNLEIHSRYTHIPPDHELPLLAPLEPRFDCHQNQQP